MENNEENNKKENGLNGFAKEVTEKIKSGEIKMKPKSYFILGNILTTGGIIISGFLGTLLTSFLIHRYKMLKLAEDTVWQGMKRPDPFTRGRLFLYNFPWWAFIIAILSVVLGIYLMRKFESGYKANFPSLIVLTVFVIVITGILIDKSGIHDMAKRHEPFNKFYPQAPRENMIKGMQNMRNTQNLKPNQMPSKYLINERVR